MPKKESLKSSSKTKVTEPSPKDDKSNATNASATKSKDNKDEKPDNYKVLIKALTNKISPKSEGEIGFELVKDVAGIIYLRLTSNTSSGNFCKTPVLLQLVIDVLNKQDVVKPFTSKVMKDVFQGKGSKNSNNTSFLIAALRSKEIALVVSDTDKPTSSRLHKELKANSEKLLAMK